MRQNLSLFQNLTIADVVREPFPHVVCKNALPDSLHEQLQQSFPPTETLGVNSKANNCRYSIKAKNLQLMSDIPQLWRDFILFHSSRAFFDEVVRVFGESICSLYPTEFPTVNHLSQWPTQIRDLEALPKNAFALDAQISGNTPAQTPGVPRGIHTDAPNALWAGLYYLRHRGDDSVGGDLQLWKWKDTFSYQNKSAFYKEGVDKRYVELLTTIPYQSNTLVFFINSLDSLHAVTERKQTIHSRQFLNLVCDRSEPFFKIRPAFHIRLSRFVHRAFTP